MSNATAASVPPARHGMGTRVMAAIAGVVIIATVCLFSVGLALGAPVGMGVLWVLGRARGITFGRTAGWMAAVAGVAVAVVVMIVFSFSRLPAGSLARIHRESFQQPARQSDVPATLRRFLPQTRPNPQVEARTRALIQSMPFQLWAMVVTLVLGAAMLALPIGSATWGGILLIGLAIGNPRARPTTRARPATTLS